jgi:glycosyltransferase involved in cell wall biosynthesis
MEMILADKDLDMQSENKDLKVAVYMITYNHEDYIAQAVESIMMQQTNFEFKLFIGEDCSTDKTAEICSSLKQKYPDKIELVLQKNNIGATNNAQQIFKLCFDSDAQYIAMLEGDDYWTDPLKLQKQVDFLDANQEYVLCFHEVVILKSDGKFVKDFLTNVPENHETIEDLAVSWNYIHTPSVVFRNVITDLPYEYQMTPIGDFFLYMMLAEKGKLKYIKQDMATYRYGVGMFSGDSGIKHIKSNLILFSLLVSYLKDEKIKKIMLRRQLRSITILEDFLKTEAKFSLKIKKPFAKILRRIKKR